MWTIDSLNNIYEMSISMKKVNSNGVPRHHEHSDRSNGRMWILRLELTQDEKYMTNLGYRRNIE
jgi:hypothetical protein